MQQAEVAPVQKLRSSSLSIWAIQTSKWYEINTLEWVHFYFIYPYYAHLQEIGTTDVLDLEYFVASRQWAFFF